MLNSLTRRLLPPKSQTHSGAGGESVLQGLFDVGNAGAVIFED